MNILTLDFETFFSDDYTLKKMTTESYIRDPRFEALGVGVNESWRGPKGWWIEQGQIAQVLKAYDWNNTAILCHHAHFDGLILSHHYGIKPRFIYDTLSMARLQLGNHVSIGLESLARHYGLAGKTVPYDLFRGRRWGDIDASLRKQLGAGCLHDVELTWEIFQRLAVGFPPEEYQVIDSTVRMFTEPQLEGDIDAFARVWTREADRKRQLLGELRLEKEDLQSAERFAGLLRSAGVDPETKTGKSGDIYAFAKTDQFMQDLLEHDDEYVRTLAECRLGQKSTLDQTRAERLGWMATRGAMPVYLSYCGAHTTRWSGGDKCLTADTKVLTLDISGTPKYKNIIDVQSSDLVWDGEEFVEHKGVVFSGYQEVVAWDGVNGTPEHQVFCAEEVKSLGEALRDGAPIMDCREPTMWEVEAGRAFQRIRFARRM